MEVYLVMYDNGEPYEDNLSGVDRIFDSRDKALAYIQSEGYEIVCDYGEFTTYYYKLPLKECEFGVRANDIFDCEQCANCPIYDKNYSCPMHDSLCDHSYLYVKPMLVL